MPDKKFKTCIIDGYEQYAVVNHESQMTEFRTERFPGSLLSFIDVNMDTISPLFSELNAGFKQLPDGPASETRSKILHILDALAEQHIYFALFRQEWRDLMERFHSERFLQKLWRQDAQHMQEELKWLQRQIQALFAHVLDIDVEGGPVPEKMASFAKAGEAFKFQPQSTSYELWNDTVFAEVLYPKSITEIVSYHLQECVKRELRLRICRNCGRYFYIISRKTALYCHRPFGKGDGTCRGVGPVYAWTQKSHKDEVLMNYRREYKRRFAWINSGKIEKDAFYAWSKLAREKKKECNDGMISREAFDEWLRQS